MSTISDIDGAPAAAQRVDMSLAELLVVVSVLGLIVGATAPALQQALGAYGDGAARIETQQATRVALERLAHDIRGAGYGGGPDAFPAVAVAEASQIVVQSDVDGDGAIGGSESIAWRLAPGGVLRRDAGGGAQPIVNGVRTFTLTYFDASGAITGAPSAVRAVRIELAAEPSRPASPGARRVVSALVTTVGLRNR